MNNYFEDDILVLCLDGSINSDNVNDIDEEARGLLTANNNPNYLLDAERLAYISSAGLRFLLKLYKENNNSLTIRNVSSDVYNIFEITGFNTFLNVKKKLRSITIEGCPVLGVGSMGTVYQIDQDTIIKVYEVIGNLDSIESEVAKAKQAFLLGVPTAIPFDIVKVGDKYGAVFELIKAQNCNDYLVENLDKLDIVCKRYANFIKSIHSVEATGIDLPDIKDMYLDHLDAVKDLISEDLYGRILKLINSIPSDNNIIHGDLQVKNVMISDNEMILIDMDTLSHGNPIFEFGGLYMTYITFCIHEPDNTLKFLNITKEDAEKLFYNTLHYYFENEDEDTYKKKMSAITVLGLLRFLFLIGGLGIGIPELRDTRIKYCVDTLEKLVQEVLQWILNP